MSTRTSRRPWLPADQLWGGTWEAYKDRYWSSRWTRKRCFWHQRLWLGPPLPYGRRQLNHLSYARGSTPRWWQVKPLCRTCHGIETTLARVLRTLGVRHEHYVATYGVRWLINVIVTAPVWYPLVFVLHVVP